MTTAAFWRATAERALRTFAQALIAVISLDGADLLTVDWPQSLSVAGLAAVISVLTSVAASGAGGGDGGPSFGPELLQEGDS